MSEILRRIARAVESGHSDAASPYPPNMVGEPGVDELTRQALAEGIQVERLLYEGLVAGMKAIGERFSEGNAFLPEVLMAARALAAGFTHLQPYFSSGAVKHRGTVVLGTVQGDLHDIGKKIVGMFFNGAGWKVVDLGVDVPLERFLAAIEEHKPKAVGLSTLLTTTMPSMAQITAGIKSRYPELKVVVGGAPLSAEFAASIGADFYGADPQMALDYLDGAV